MRKFTYCAFADEAADSLAGQADALCENGLQGLEIRGIDGKNISEISPADAGEIRKFLCDRGLFVWSVGSPIGKIGIRESFAPHFDLFQRTLETAVTLGAGAMRIFSFFMPAGEDPGIYRDEVAERLDRMIQSAKDSGVVLCHENEKEIYGDTTRRCQTLYQALPALRAVFDPANFVQCGEDTKKAWALLSDSVFYMHIKDAVSGGDVVPPGTGDGQLPELIRAYAEKGGEVLTLEPHLMSFTGLSSLERDGGRSGVGGLHFASRREAFDFAVKKLREITENT